MVVMDTDRFLYPTLATRTTFLTIDFRGDLHSEIAFPKPIAGHNSVTTREHHIDNFISRTLSREWKTFIKPWRKDRAGIYEYTRQGEVVRDYIFRGYTYDIIEQRRDLKETSRFLIETFEKDPAVSGDIFAIIDHLPMRFFEDVHCAALSFRMAAERDKRGIWRRANTNG